MNKIRILAVAATLVGLGAMTSAARAEPGDNDHSSHEVDMRDANAGAAHVEHERDVERMHDYQREAGSRDTIDNGRVGAGGSSTRDRSGSTIEGHVTVHTDGPSKPKR